MTPPPPATRLGWLGRSSGPGVVAEAWCPCSGVAGTEYEVDCMARVRGAIWSGHGAAASEGSESGSCSYGCCRSLRLLRLLGSLSLVPSPVRSSASPAPNGREVGPENPRLAHSAHSRANTDRTLARKRMTTTNEGDTNDDDGPGCSSGTDPRLVLSSDSNRDCAAPSAGSTGRRKVGREVKNSGKAFKESSTIYQLPTTSEPLSVPSSCGLLWEKRRVCCRVSYSETVVSIAGQQGSAEPAHHHQPGARSPTHTRARAAGCHLELRPTVPPSPPSNRTEQRLPSLRSSSSTFAGGSLASRLVPRHVHPGDADPGLRRSLHHEQRRQRPTRVAHQRTNLRQVLAGARLLVRHTHATQQAKHARADEPKTQRMGARGARHTNTCPSR